MKRPADALASYDQAIALAPALLGVHNNRGLMLMALERQSEALAAFDRELAINPVDAKTLNNRGVALFDLGRSADALDSYDRALALDPDYAEAINNRGVALRKLKRPADALACHERAMALRPGYIDAFRNSIAALRELGRLEEALSACEQALAVDSADPDTLASYALVQYDIGKFEGAIAAIDKALESDPRNAEAVFSRAMIALKLGDFEAGWRDYETRFDQKDYGAHALHMDLPRWSGEPIAGKHVIVYEEQGLGDVIQFARYLPLLAEAGATVTFYVKSKLHRLLRPLAKSVEIIDEPKPGYYDYQAAIMSLPRGFGTTHATIPANVPYLQPEPDLIDRWRDRINPAGFKIGIIWQGNPDSNADIGRSYPVAALQAIAGIPGVRLISLQRYHGLDQLTRLPAAMQVETLGDDFDSGPDAFVDTAAVMASLDLIITSDTANAHLAGALGRPVWIAVKHVCEWRWLCDRSDNPWYPTARIYRQTARGDWPGVFDAMAKDLSQMLSGPNG
jgi:Flp pilus assembly protein TadD